MNIRTAFASFVLLTEMTTLAMTGEPLGTVPRGALVLDQGRKRVRLPVPAGSEGLPTRSSPGGERRPRARRRNLVGRMVATVRAEQVPPLTQEDLARGGTSNPEWKLIDANGAAGREERAEKRGQKYISAVCENRTPGVRFWRSAPLVFVRDGSRAFAVQDTALVLTGGPTAAAAAAGRETRAPKNRASHPWQSGRATATRGLA
jgi:hypothetical protein